MNTDKQIEEIAELERLLRIRRIDIEKQGCDIFALIKKTTSEEQAIAEYLIGHNYRKASEVAEEIFAEIEKIALQGVSPFGLRLMSMGTATFAELKKKYTEEGK